MVLLNKNGTNKIHKHEDFIIMKLHECQDNFKKLQLIYDFEEEKSPINETLRLLQDEFPLKTTAKKYQQRLASLHESTDELPMHVILIRSDYISKIHKCDMDPIAHCKMLRVAGSTNMAYIDEFVIKKSHRGHGYGRYFFKSLEEFLKMECDQDKFGLCSRTETDRSFFHHMGMSRMKTGERIPFIDVHEGQLHQKLNSFFSVAKHAMDRKRDNEKVWMSKDLFHYNLYGTGAYKLRLAAIAEANRKVQEELDEKKVGGDYKRPEVDVSAHVGVGRIASLWSAARRASLAALHQVSNVGRRLSRAA
ncbi:Oidioi.mRNA.OKI2018_I69.PAR.g9948.t1.cds [Oikopleura dioica]|uniref:Oidioi.mRNA.OKI2018_I69.PAR.g9948.t1.cds n=1 Tax=Oikopleura dioica TaxID=34765 RepID=A0ABN7RS72_OIKDI|nr:Oidioi.mRNA.OKI2018_I69.PAR.g9948.t1.cds [Oikopleura dioica]